MAQDKNIKNKDKTPTLYSFNNNQYDFDDLSNRVYSGLGDYISTIKKGDKYETDIRNAVSNMMSGIKDGTITFNNGRYNDSLGRYRNSQDKNKDVYGWAANYILSNMNNSQKYVDPQESEKGNWNDTTLSRELLKGIFNSEQPNVNYFIEQDEINPETNTRGTSARVKLITDWIDNNVNDQLFNKYNGYTDEDKQRYIKLAQDASTKLKENGFDSKDYLYLSRVFPGISWEDMFNTKQEQTQNQTENESEEEPQDFSAFMNKQFPRTVGDTANVLLNINGTTLGPGTNRDIVNWANSLDYQSSYNFLNTFISNPTYNKNVGSSLNPIMARAIIQRLERDGKLVQDSSDSNIYYIPELIDNKTHSGFYYDSKTKTLYKKNIQDIPYWYNQLQTKYFKNFSNPDLNQYFTTTQYEKNGGVIKAQTGVKFSNNANWYSGVLQPELTHIINGLNSDSNYYKWLNDMQDKHSNIYNLAGDNWQNTAYNNDLVGQYQDLYKSGYNNEWKDNASGYNSLGIQNAQNQGMFDLSGRTRVSGDWNGNGHNWTSDNLYSAITDYRRLLGRKGDYTQDQLENVTKKFRQAGYDFYLDKNDYYKLQPLIKPVAIAGNKDLFDIPDQLSLKVPSTDKEDSFITPQSNEKGISNNRTWNIISGIIPDLIGAGRLFASLNTNNKVARTLNESLKPVLKDTYERYSPVTGAFGEMQFRKDQAAGLRRQVSRPFTSDASLQLAGQLDAGKQARDFEYQGFLADNKEIQRTAEAALARQEDNMARRSEVANFNRASMNQTDREKSALEATRLRRNWQSIDNFLANIEGRLRNKYELDKERRDNFRLQTSLLDIDDTYQNAVQKATDDVRNWVLNNPSKSISSMPNYNKYVDAMREINRWKQAQTYKTHANIYGYNYDNPLLLKDPKSIMSKYGYKNGGVLKPSTIQLINKIIKNESDT